MTIQELKIGLRVRCFYWHDDRIGTVIINDGRNFTVKFDKGNQDSCWVALGACHFKVYIPDDMS